MNINVNIKRKFKVNGKEYNSIEEMPDEIREAFKKAMDTQVSESSTATRTRIIFDGAEYGNIDAMPQDVRQLYEKAMKAAEGGASLSAPDIKEISGTTKRPDSLPGSFPGAIHTAPKVEPSFSPRVLIVGVLIALALILFYFLFHAR